MEGKSAALRCIPARTATSQHSSSSSCVHGHQLQVKRESSPRTQDSVVALVCCSVPHCCTPQVPSFPPSSNSHTRLTASPTPPRLRSHFVLLFFNPINSDPPERNSLHSRAFAHRATKMKTMFKSRSPLLLCLLDSRPAFRVLQNLGSPQSSQSRPKLLKVWHCFCGVIPPPQPLQTPPPRIHNSLPASLTLRACLLF